MLFTIIVSDKDIAGLNIKDSLLNLFKFRKSGLFQGKDAYSFEFPGKEIRLITLQQDTVFYDTAEKDNKTDYFIFATRHQSKSGEKTLSIHCPGNFTNPDFGGVKEEFCTLPASLIKTAFINLNDLGKESGYEISLEATHHGPLIRKPVMFIEIGSREEQWKDKKAAEIIAKTIMKTIEQYKNQEYETAIGFGGLHYCSNFNKIELNSKTALSHICPKYNIKFLDKELIKKMIAATHEKVDFALLDWKGLSSEDKRKLIPLLEKINLKFKKTKEIQDETH